MASSSLMWELVMTFTIKELAELIADVVGLKGELVFDTSKPDGTPRKLMDVSVSIPLAGNTRPALEKG